MLLNEEISAEEVLDLLNKKVLMAVEARLSPTRICVSEKIWLVIVEYFHTKVRNSWDHNIPSRLQYNHPCGVIDIAPYSLRHLESDAIFLDEDDYHDMLLEREIFNEDTILRR